MPDRDPTPDAGRPLAQGQGREPTPRPGLGSSAEARDLDPPTVRTGAPGSSAKSGSALSRQGGDEPAPNAANSVSVPPPLPRPGDLIDVYELEEAIGAGGMGAVFRAIDTKLDRQVALKILPPDQAVDPEVVLRYHQEGRAAARLDHENIARVYTIGDNGKYHYIVFEYIEGITIRQRVERDGPLPVGDAINYTLQIAGALVHAAERGVVHRDIKPSNIIITPQGRAKLVDMGLARRFERGEDTGLTQSGMTLGTFDYISPEQARDPRDVDTRGDLYSLGCTLFHMLSGRPPFPEGTVLQKLIQHQEEPPPDIQGLNPAVPDDLAAILVKLMAKDRDRRYQTPEQLVRDLMTVAGSLGLRSLNTEGLVWLAPGTAPGWTRHLVWGLPALAFLVVLGGLAWWGDAPIFSQPAAEHATALPTDPAPRRDRTDPRPASKPSGEPAAEPLPREVAVETSAELARALAEAPRGSTILLAGPGPFELRGAGQGTSARKLSGLEVTIKAEADVRPVIRLRREAGTVGSAPAAVVDVVGGRLTFDGVDFVVDAAESGEVPAAIRLEDGELTLRRCAFRREGGQASPKSRPVTIQVNARGRAGRPIALPGASVFLDACDFGPGQGVVVATGSVEVVARDCTFAPPPPGQATFGFENPEPAGLVPVSVAVVRGSVIAGPDAVFRFQNAAARVRVSSTVFAPAGEGAATLVAIDDPDRLDWRGVDNLFARISAYLMPTRTATGRVAIRGYATWADDERSPREVGSLAISGTPWREADPVEALLLEPADPSRVFRLSLPRSAASLPHPGARQGPYGPLSPPVFEPLAVASSVATSPAVVPPKPTPAPRPDVPAMAPAVASLNPPVTPAPPVVSQMPTAPLTMPTPVASTGRIGEAGEAAAAANPTASEGTGQMPMPMPIVSEPEKPVVARVDPAPPLESAPLTVTPVAKAVVPPAVAAEPAVLRTAEEFRDALARPGAPGRVLVIAADADWSLPALTIKGASSWTIRAGRGATRPRLRFRPDPTDPAMATRPWPALLTLQGGGLRLEGIDVILAAADAPRSRRWAAFALGMGSSELTLADCTVTIEGAMARSAAVAVLASGDLAAEIPALIPAGPGAVPSAPAARVRVEDGLFRVGGDLVDVAAGRLLDLDIDNAAIATGGALAHGHGLPRGKLAEPVEIGLRRVAALLGGGLALLESTPNEPELPIAEVVARDSVFAVTDPDAPLFRVDGQGDLDQLRDRVRWEGRSVAYHQIRSYRRDQTARPGALPTLFDRESWQVAVGPSEEAAIHGDLRFQLEWDPERPAWTLRPDDVRLRPDSPASNLGPDLLHIPSPPSTRGG